jgi:hypothetical protein
MSVLFKGRSRKRCASLRIERMSLFVLGKGFALKQGDTNGFTAREYHA